MPLVNCFGSLVGLFRSEYQIWWGQSPDVNFGGEFGQNEKPGPRPAVRDARLDMVRIARTLVSSLSVFISEQPCILVSFSFRHVDSHYQHVIYNKYFTYEWGTLCL